jgi:pectate lyase
MDPRSLFPTRSFLPQILTASALLAASCTEPMDGLSEESEAALTSCTIPSYVAATTKPVGWASLNGGTTGGGSATPVVVTTLAAFNTAAKGTTAAVIYVSGKLGQGTFTIGSNKTIMGCSGSSPSLNGHVGMSGSANVIIRNLSIVGYNCALPEVDVANGGQCQNGSDAVSIDKSSHNIWIDHDSISDGSDGNMDITHASDFVTVSYTKFSYSTKRADPNDTGAMGHRVSNLVGHSDSNASEDTGHLNVTWHHNWWGANVMERQPRVRFGKNHIFNNLYTAAGNNYCIGIGVNANVLDQDNAFVGVANPIESASYSNSASIVSSRNNTYSGTSGLTADKGTGVFTPSYSFTSEAASLVQADVQANAGPK